MSGFEFQGNRSKLIRELLEKIEKLVDQLGKAHQKISRLEQRISRLEKGEKAGLDDLNDLEDWTNLNDLEECVRIEYDEPSDETTTTEDCFTIDSQIEDTLGAIRKLLSKRTDDG